mmetsp:Transcript_48424/g.156209  ORF Transcript_48424/g.156209 Transcript_48424/m.156209 type:complete len:90 (-) Transcript_48424:81-350(-)
MLAVSASYAWTPGPLMSWSVVDTAVCVRYARMVSCTGTGSVRSAGKMLSRRFASLSRLNVQDCTGCPPCLYLTVDDVAPLPTDVTRWVS